MRTTLPILIVSGMVAVAAAASAPATRAKPAPAPTPAPSTTPAAAPAPAAQAAQPASPTGALAPLDFLLGRWEADPQPGQPTGACSFTPDLQGRVIVRRNHSDVPATADRPAAKHDDLMIIYASRDGAVEADYFDNEGHVIHYDVRKGAEGSLTFLSPAVPGGPRFRLSYQAANPALVAGRFEMAPPDKPDAFSPYLSWSMHKAAE